MNGTQKLEYIVRKGWRWRRRVAPPMLVLTALFAWQWSGKLEDQLGRTDPLVSAGLALAYGASASVDPTTDPVELQIDLDAATFELDPRYVSFALDTSVVVGGRWWSKSGEVEVGRGTTKVEPFDLADRRLQQLTRALSPAYLRVGGTEADHVFYAVGNDAAKSPPEGYELSLTEERWSALNTFTRATALDLFFTINAGPGARTEAGAWSTQNAEELVRHAARRGDEVPVWELGNEVNAYWFIHGLRHQPSGARYAQDLRSFRQLVKGYFPSARVAGPSSAFFPVVGEPFESRFGILGEFLEHGGGDVDIVTWHYYPQQSRRCPVATRRASLDQLLAPSHLDEVQRWSAKVLRLRDESAPSAEVWLGETGHAQCGGEPQLSDRYVSGLWWLDQLGLMASRGQAVVVRQALVGADYGLLDSETLQPRPDYYNTLLWKRIMGRRVLGVKQQGQNPYLRAYAHCRASGAPGAAILLLNLHERDRALVDLGTGSISAVRYDLASPTLDGEHLYLDDKRLQWADGGVELPGHLTTLIDGTVRVPALGYTFLELDLPAAACSPLAR